MGLIYSAIPELEGSNTEISLANLSELEEQIESVLEKRFAHLTELAEAILKDSEDTDVIKSIFLSIKSDGNADSGNVIDENRPAADAIFSKISLFERLTLFKETFERFSIEKKELFKQYWREDMVEVSKDASERIAYLKNSYTDTVYLQFSSLLSSPRAAYFGSVVDVCESVYNGECEYCILPVETAGDGKLLSFYEMILKYGFKINSVYDLVSGSDYTRYALLSKNFAPYDSGLRTKSRNRYFEFLLVENESLTLDELLSASSFCSLKLRRIDTFNIDKSGKKLCVCPVFRVDGADMVTFLSFLAIDCPDFIPIGLYKQI